jgi:hypothetical protein
MIRQYTFRVTHDHLALAAGAFRLATIRRRELSESRPTFNEVIEVHILYGARTPYHRQRPEKRRIPVRMYASAVLLELLSGVTNSELRSS